MSSILPHFLVISKAIEHSEVSSYISPQRLESQWVINQCLTVMKNWGLSINLFLSLSCLFSAFQCTRHMYHLLMAMANGIITNEVNRYWDTSKCRSPKAACIERCLERWADSTTGGFSSTSARGTADTTGLITSNEKKQESQVKMSSKILFPQKQPGCSC